MNARLSAAGTEAESIVSNAKNEAKQIVALATQKSNESQQSCATLLNAAARHIADIRRDSERKAREVAGMAFDAMTNGLRFEQLARAMKNIVDGYGDRYLRSARSLLDDLADEFSHKE